MPMRSARYEVDVFEQFLAEIRNLDVVYALFGALIAGALIGSEREVRGKAAGLRTHTLVCFAASLMTLLGLRMDEWHAVLPPGTQIVSDMSRMPHAVLTGVGFLGAGVIFRDGLGVQGLTTAATLWLTAAIGVVFGTGLWGLASLATVTALIVLTALQLFQARAQRVQEARIALAYALDDAPKVAEVLAILQNRGLKPMAYALEEDHAKAERVLEVQIKGDLQGFAPENLRADLERQVQLKRFQFADHLA